jgi:charged multivesicular body protein 3
MFAGLFGKKKLTLKEQGRQWERDLRKQGRELDRESQKLIREENKVKNEIKKLAKDPTTNKKALIALSRGLVRSQRQREKFLTTKSHLNSIALTIKTQVATASVVGQLEKSNAVMKSLSRVINVPEIAAVTREMSKQMMKAGIIDEMVQEAFEMDDEEMEEEVEKQVSDALYEVTKGQLSIEVGQVTNNLHKQQEEEAEAKRIEQQMGGLDDMKTRLANLQV